MIPRYGRPPKPGQKYQVRRGVYAILPLEDMLLLTHQAAPTAEFQLPGGGIDPGEAPGPALAREVLEETGWSIAKPRFFGTFRRFTYMPEYKIWAEKICSVYVSRPIRAVTSDLEPGHIPVWVRSSCAIDLLGNAGDRAMLAKYLKNLGRGRGIPGTRSKHRPEIHRPGHNRPNAT